VKLIVGLGNPGRKYEATRHNAGFWWVEELAARVRAAWRADTKFHGRIARVDANSIWLLLPDTYMNESGRAVGALASYYRIEAEDMLVVHDELDLPPGGVKLKKGGGTAGHNGLGDIAECLGTKDFWRLRVGIGHPRDAGGGQVIDYVLHPPRAEEAAPIREAIGRSLDL
jgi:PTH1 family peptidyl-tRNA hydrolase